MHIRDAYDCDGNGWSVVSPTDANPDSLTTFYANKGNKDAFAHFFIDDYRFERLWRVPERYLGALGRYQGAIAPDFSLYTDMPLPMQAWNSYRSKALASYWQESGIDVIPCISWSDQRSYDFAFEGWPTSSTVAISTVGVMRSGQARSLFELGLFEMVKRLRPQRILVYGTDPGIGDLPCPVVVYPNDNTRRVKQWEDAEHRADRAAAEQGRR